jgi:cytochrome c553
MLSSHLNDPEHWRDRSKEARAMAEGMADSVSKQKMLDVAANYEHLAQRAEDRRTGKAPKP